MNFIFNFTPVSVLCSKKVPLVNMNYFLYSRFLIKVLLKKQNDKLINNKNNM